MHNPARIRIVDDNASNRDILKTRLEVHGYDLLEAASRSLGIVKEHCPDLVLLDVMMPKIGGIEVCRRLKGNSAFPFLSVILVTARAGSRSDQRMSDIAFLELSERLAKLLIERPRP